jgi:uncharacterized protein (TIGR04255 family)
VDPGVALDWKGRLVLADPSCSPNDARSVDVETQTMTDTLNRPADLPDFELPPLHEVVVGVQFRSPRGYRQIRAGEVWELFKDQYPDVEEHPPIPPIFETFGRPQPSQPNIQFVQGTSHDRFWFISSSRNELLQFQSDRLLHNWRKVETSEEVYPRFERMIQKFHGELQKLESYFFHLHPQNLEITQCEISYINHIPKLDAETGMLGHLYLKFLNFSDFNPDDFFTIFRVAIRDAGGAPVGRLICECRTALDSLERELIVFTLTVRGAPKTPTIESGLAFLEFGRKTVVNAFASMTTASAHQAWRRIR